MLTENTPLNLLLGTLESFPVAADAHIFEGALVGINAQGYARGLVAGDKFVGHGKHEADNRTKEAGESRISVEFCRYRLQVHLPGVSLTDLGNKVYASDDGTLTLTAASNTEVGKVTRFVGTDTAIVEFKTL